MVCYETGELSEHDGLRWCMWSGVGGESWLAGAITQHSHTYTDDNAAV